MKIQKVTQPTIHGYLEDLIGEKYGIHAKFTNVIAWGYQTLSIYMEDVKEDRYLIKRTYNYHDNLANIEISTRVENYMNNVLPTAQYIKNKDGAYLTLYGNEIIRLQHFIEGVAPFDMTLDILEQALWYLMRIHQTKLSVARDLGLKTTQGILEDTNAISNVFLHGDLTPSNILVSHGKITALLDFEYASIGPKEYDISRLCVFTSFHMTTNIVDLMLHAKKCYSGGFDESLFAYYAKMHLNQRLENLKKHKESHEDMNLWKVDVDTTTFKLEEVYKLVNSTKDVSVSHT